jgi:hypothetical protein
MILDPPSASPLPEDERCSQAIELFNAHDWYAAHDAFEELWHEALGGKRKLLQGIIQLAVAEHHLNNGNQRGALLLMAEGVNHLQACLALDSGLDLQLLRATASLRLAALQADQNLADLPLPRLERIDPGKV